MSVVVLGLLSLSLLGAETALQDPTRPTSPDRSASTRAAGPDPGGWTLNSTLVAPNRRVAVINGVQVSEGESVDGARVVKIRKSDVLMQIQGHRITLYLLPNTAITQH